MRMRSIKLGTVARLQGAVFFSSILVFVLAGSAVAQSPFYRGKTITILNGNDPGGTGDMRMRAVIPYLRKYIPGEPTILAEFMAGGGGRKVANHIYRGVPRDGLTIGFPPGGFVSLAILGEPGVQYDLDKLMFLGTPESATQYIFYTRKDAGLDKLEKLLASSGLRVGAQSVGHTIYIAGRLFAYVLGIKQPKFVIGYSGPEVDHALMRGEVDARAQIADSVLTRNPELIEKGLVHFHAIMEIPKGDRHPRFAHLPEIETFAKDERDRKLVDLFRSFRGIGGAFILPPDTPKDRFEILTQAMNKVFEDRDFHKEFKKLTGDDPSPLTGERLQMLIKKIPREPAVIGLFRKIAGGETLPER
jgi:tripartite-type tricarboxylate transporter receptor subunit TctC